MIYFGPQAQVILRPYLDRHADAYCFSPAEAEAERRQSADEARKTPLTYGNAPGTNKRRAWRKAPGDLSVSRKAARRMLDDLRQGKPQ